MKEGRKEERIRHICPIIRDRIHMIDLPCGAGHRVIIITIIITYSIAFWDADPFERANSEPERHEQHTAYFVYKLYDCLPDDV